MLSFKLIFQIVLNEMNTMIGQWSLENSPWPRTTTEDRKLATWIVTVSNIKWAVQFTQFKSPELGTPWLRKRWLCAPSKKLKVPLTTFHMIQ